MENDHESIAEQLDNIFKELLFSTNPSEWKKAPNTFVSLCIPDKITDFIDQMPVFDDSTKELLLSTLLSSLICEGISSLAVKDLEYIELMKQEIQ